jgi:hypothetical protein
MAEQHEDGAVSAAEADETPAQTGVQTIQMDVLSGKHMRAPGDELGESLAHWRRLMYVALGHWPFGLAGRRDFNSVAVPAHFADALRATLESGGYATRLSDAYTDEARMLTFWRPA